MFWTGQSCTQDNAEILNVKRGGLREGIRRMWAFLYTTVIMGFLTRMAITLALELT